VIGVRLVLADDVAAFVATARPLLRELGVATHGLHLGVLAQVEAGTSEGESELWAVRAEDELVGVVLRTPPYPYAVALRPDRSGGELGIALAAARLAVADVLGDTDVVGAVARAWAAALGTEAQRTMGMHVLTCEQVIHPPPIAGGWRAATPDDADTVRTFALAFLREALPEAGEDPEERAARVTERLRGDHGIHLWVVDGQPASLTSIGMPAEGAERITSVYTPPRLRGRGYAGALVAALTQDALDRGCTHVQLNTDVSNPVSNALYERLGYVRVGGQETWRTSAVS
jgi:predicted GNAT family acetyltransferase